MFRVNGVAVFSANSGQTLTSAQQLVVYTGNGTGTYTYTLPRTIPDGLFADRVPPGQRIIIRQAGSGASTITVAKHASDTGIYLGFSTAVTSFNLVPGQAIELMSDGNGYWYMVDGANFFDNYDDIEMLVSARAASTNSALPTNIGTGVEGWTFQPSTVGPVANKWLMGQKQITHGWDKLPVFWHVHFTPKTDLVAAGTGIVITWTMVWRSVQPGQVQAYTDEANLTMTYSLGAGTLSLLNNYDASVGGNDSPTTITNAAASTMILARLELTSVTNNSVDQTTEILVNGWDAHAKHNRRGTINPWPEP